MPRLLFIALLSLAAGLATAAPGPRAPGSGTAPATSSSRTRPAAAPDAMAWPVGRGIESACGTRLERLTEITEGHLARPESEPLPTPHSTDEGEIAVLEDDGTFFYTNKGNDVIADLATIGQSFYRTHGDDYDCLAIYLSTGLTTWLGSPTAIAAAFVVRNPTLGIGLDVFDYGTEFGSPSRLQSMLDMNGLQVYPADPNADIHGDSFSALDVVAHEFGHRWLSYVRVDSAGTASNALLGRDLQHWSFFFDADSSYMEGCDWANVVADSFRTDGVAACFGNLDLYLMGLRSKTDTPPFFTLHDATSFDPPGIYVPYTGPFVGLGCRARAHFWTVGDIEAANGVREPNAATAPHTFRVAFVLITARGQAATPADLVKLGQLRTAFPPAFAVATQGLGAIDATIDSHAGRVVIVHDPLKDQTSPASAFPVGAHVSIEQAGIPLALDPASPRLFFRSGTSGPFTSVPLAPVSGDSFAAAIPPPGFDGVIQYYLHASSDSTGIDAFAPPGGPLAPYSFVVGPDFTLPVLVHVPIPSRGASQMPVTLIARVTDNVALADVAVWWGEDGLIANRTPAAPVGRDSFAVTIGAGIPAGHTLDYYFEAHDASGNTGRSESLVQGNHPWSITIGGDWAFDFENGPEGVIHVPYWYSYRDAWHLTTEDSSPSGGTSWKCGDDFPKPYPVHLDATLVLPVIASVEPGTRLRFDHRYALEQLDAGHAWDGARIEAQSGPGPWAVVVPTAGYDHVFISNSNPFEAGTPCWSGVSGWRTETVDLTPWAPGPVRLRFRMLADDFTGFDGWFVDRVRVEYPSSSGAVSPIATLEIGAAWPNPSGGRVRQSFSLERSAEVEWTLHDLAGRRVATLARGIFPAGARDLAAALPAGLPDGLYFLSLRIGDQPARSQRLALIR